MRNLEAACPENWIRFILVLTPVKSGELPLVWDLVLVLAALLVAGAGHGLMPVAQIAGTGSCP